MYKYWNSWKIQVYSGRLALTLPVSALVKGASLGRRSMCGHALGAPTLLLEEPFAHR